MVTSCRYSLLHSRPSYSRRPWSRGSRCRRSPTLGQHMGGFLPPPGLLGQFPRSSPVSLCLAPKVAGNAVKERSRELHLTLLSLCGNARYHRVGLHDGLGQLPGRLVPRGVVPLVVLSARLLAVEPRQVILQPRVVHRRPSSPIGSVMLRTSLPIMFATSTRR